MVANDVLGFPRGCHVSFAAAAALHSHLFLVPTAYAVGSGSGRRCRGCIHVPLLVG